MICKIRCLKNKLAEIIEETKDYNVHLVLLQESWLDTSTESVALPGFYLLSRRGSEGPNRGGVVAFVRQDVNNTRHLYNSVSAERSWHVLHRDTNSIAICNWYYSPSAGIQDIETLHEELLDMQKKI